MARVGVVGAGATSARWTTALGRTARVATGVVLWGLSSTAGGAERLALFAASVALVLAGLGRRPSIACAVAAFMATALANDVPWMGLVAAAFLAGAVWHFVRRRFPRAGVRGMRLPNESLAPAAWLAHGPLAAVASRTYTYQRGRRALRVLFVGSALATLAAAVVAATGNPLAALGAPAAILCTTFGGVLWYTSRNRVRVDAFGVHQRAWLREHTVRWTDVSDLVRSTVTVRFIGYGATMRTYYYAVRSPTSEVGFYDTLTDYGTLRDTIEQATEMRWPS